MNQHKPEKLILNLSLYLDNELPNDEMLEIEELLKIDSEIASIFNSLRKTKEVLRNTPNIKRRRSFTLSPELAQQTKKQGGLLSSMKMVSTFAMILMLAVFTQNMMSNWSPNSSAIESDIGLAAELISPSQKDLALDEAIESSADFQESVSGMGGVIEDTECEVENVCLDTVSVMSTDEIRTTESEIETFDVEEVPDASFDDGAVIDEMESESDKNEIGDSIVLSDVFMIVLILFSALSLGYYLILRKKFN